MFSQEYGTTFQFVLHGMLFHTKHGITFFFQYIIYSHKGQWRKLQETIHDKL